MMPIENIQELRSDGAWNINFVFAHSLHTALQVEPNGAINFYDAGFLAMLGSCRFVTS